MTIESRKDKEKKFKRDYIIEQALILFLENGFENTTMSEIAKKSDFAKGTLYLYFSSKDEIIIEIKILLLILTQAQRLKKYSVF